MVALLTSLLSSFVLSGTIGYASYGILHETADVYFSARNKDEKGAFISFLSFITFMVLFGCYTLFSLFNLSVLMHMFLTVVTAFIIMMILDFYFLPKVIKFIRNSNNSKRSESGFAKYINTSNRNQFFSEEKERIIYMFTLEGKYITSGTLTATALEPDMYQEYTLSSMAGPSKLTIEQIEDCYPEYDFKIFVDVENNIQVYEQGKKIN